MKSSWNFEVYTRDPITGATGWDIKFPNIFAETMKEARQILMDEYPDFDVVILFNHNIPMSHADMVAYASGKNYRDTIGD
jgi:hypothetical protein